MRKMKPKILCLATALLIPSLGVAGQVNYFDLCGPTRESQSRRWAYKCHMNLGWEIEQNPDYSAGFSIAVDIPADEDQTVFLTWTVPVIYFDRLDLTWRSSQSLICQWIVVFEDGSRVISGPMHQPASRQGFSTQSLDLLRDCSIPKDLASKFPEGLTEEFLKKSGVRLLTLQIKPATKNRGEINLLIDRMETFCK